MDLEKGIEFTRRVYWIAGVRAALCVFAASMICLNLEPSAAAESLLPYAVAAAALAAGAAWVLWAHRGVSLKALASVQTVFDLAFVTALVYLSGAAGSDFLLLYFGPILAATVLFRRTAALLTASVATIGLFASSAVYEMTMNAPPLVAPGWLLRGPAPPAQVIAALTFQGAAFHLVAFLASTLILRLRWASIETEQILETLSDGVITVGKGGQVVFANSRARQMLSLVRGRALIGRPFEAAAPGPVGQAFWRVISSGVPVSLEVEMGTRRTPVEVMVFPVFGPGGTLRGANVMIHDLTERRRLVEALRRADRLEATAATVASIAHEIRNPLAAIRGSAQELRGASNLSGADASLLDLVVRESDRLNRVLAEFLSFSRMPKPQRAPLDLRALLEEVAAQLKYSSNGSKPDVSVAGPADVRLTGDSEQLRQVFVNLGLNALDATGGRGPVAFRIELLPGRIVVDTRDRGTGIDDSIREKVFEPFFTTKTTGTGLGLPIASRIVEEHGGAIECGRDAEGWTCVKVSLPAADRVGGPSAGAPAGGTQAQSARP